MFEYIVNILKNPIINTFIYTDGEEIGLGITLTIILLAAWIFGFSNRAK